MNGSPIANTLATRPARNPLWLKYWTVVLLGWQDSLVYRANAVMWAMWAVLPTITLMLVWIAAYGALGPNSKFGGYTLSGMITYYGCVTFLRVSITPNFEWDMATQIRDGKITGFIVRPIGYFGYRIAQEASYQIVKTLMTLPILFVLAWFFRDYLSLPYISFVQGVALLLVTLMATVMLAQIKFLIGMSAFWIAEAQGLMELWGILANVLGGALLPIALLPVWLKPAIAWLPFQLLYAFPLSILQGQTTTHDFWLGLVKQLVWISILTLSVHVGWKRGLLAYEGYGG